MRFFKSSSLFGAILSAVLMAAAWAALAPTQLGGKVSYVIVDGNSMEPKFRLGDLALVRKQSAYQTGDAVAYWNAEMGEFVFHRIVDIQAGRFILQGDNNTWLDTYQPGPDEIVGKLWFHIPALGKAIQWMRQPFPLAIVSGLLGGIMIASIIPDSHRRGKKRENYFGGVAGLAEGGLLLTGLMTLAFLGLSVFAFTRPLTRSTGGIPYQQDGYFFYSAAAAPGVYDMDTIRSGDPIFPKMTCFLRIGLAYNITGVGLQEAMGTHQLYARVMDEKSGWQRTVPLVNESPFNGNSYISVADVDLCQIQSMTASIEQQTGLHPAVYTLEVIGRTTVMGKIADQLLFDTFDASLVFKFDKIHFYLAEDAARSDPFRTAKQGLIGGGVTLNTVSVFGWEFTVQTVRILALFGLALSLCGLLAFGWYFFNETRYDEARLIRLKYGSLLMDVYSLGWRQDLPVVEVASMDDLARLAERQNTMIAHMAVNFLHFYMVRSNDVIYRYVVSEGRRGAAEIEPPSQPYYLPDGGENYMNAEPLDDDYYRYQVMDQGGEAQPEADRSIFIRRARL